MSSSCADWVEAYALFAFPSYRTRWALEHGPSADPLELRIYRGADCSFLVYEDDGVSTAYVSPHNQSATIALEWDESTSTLHVGERKGSFVGMLDRRSIRVVLVSSGHGQGLEPAENADATFTYNGSAVDVKVKQ